MKKYFSLIAIYILSACAFIPHNVAISPPLNVVPVQQGSGKPIFVKLTDARSGSDNIIGYWGKNKDAPITTNQDLVPILRTKIEEGLRLKGFTNAVTQGNHTTLQVALRELNYTDDYSDWKRIHATARAALHANIRQGDRVVFERDYTAAHGDKYLIAPSEHENVWHINSALAGVLNQMLNDAQLLKALEK